MDEHNNEILKVLIEIKETLNRIYFCFENQYFEIQEQKNIEKIKVFESILTESRRKVFPLLFNEKHLSQSEISKIGGISQQAVSQFVKQLIDNDLIEQRNENEKVIYFDKYDLKRIIYRK